MSGQADPWDAMAQNDDSDEDYNFVGADGIDDEDQDLEPQDDDDDYRDGDEDDTSDDDEFGDLGDVVLSPCMLSSSCVTSAERGTGYFADVELGDDGEPYSATVAALQELAANGAGARMIRLVEQARQTSQQVQAEPEDEDYDDIYATYWGYTHDVRRAGDSWYPKITEPQPAGVRLLRSGDFGKARNRLGTPRNSNIYSRLRRVALQPRAVDAVDLKHNLTPNTHGTTVAAYYSNIYVAQFSPGTSHGTPVLFF